MIRRFLSSALCLILSPLLIAQQTVQPAVGPTKPPQIQVNLNGVAEIRFLTPRLDSLAQIRSGEPVQFAVATDVISGDAVLLHAGAPVAGVIEQVKRASRFHHRDGQISIRVTEMVSGTMTEVMVHCPNPADRYVASSSSHGKAIVGTILVLGFALLVGFAVTHMDS